MKQKGTDNTDRSKWVHEALKMPEATESGDSNVDGKQSNRSGREDARPSIYI